MTSKLMQEFRQKIQSSISLFSLDRRRPAVQPAAVPTCPPGADVPALPILAAVEPKKERDGRRLPLAVPSPHNPIRKGCARSSPVARLVSRRGVVRVTLPQKTEVIVKWAADSVIDLAPLVAHSKNWGNFLADVGQLLHVVLPLGFVSVGAVNPLLQSFAPCRVPRPRR